MSCQQCLYSNRYNENYYKEKIHVSLYCWPGQKFFLKRSPHHSLVQMHCHYHKNLVLTCTKLNLNLCIIPYIKFAIHIFIVHKKNLKSIRDTQYEFPYILLKFIMKMKNSVFWNRLFFIHGLWIFGLNLLRYYFASL
jgi:hypothetical protein